MEAKYERHLLEVLEDRGIPLTTDDISWAFQSQQTKDDAVAWVKEYLNQETLLSKEELELSRKVSKRNVTITDPSAPQIPTLTDEGIREALSTIQLSTAAIEEQSKTLEAQKNALLSIKAANRSTTSADRFQTERKRHQADEKNRLKFDVDDVSSSTNSKLSAARRDVETMTHPFLSSITDQLGADDRSMSRLTKVLQILEANAGERQDLAQVEKWFQSLAKLRELEVKARIDADFATSLLKNAHSDDYELTAREVAHEKAALQEELKSLRLEVASVADMVVNHELREPMLQYTKSQSDNRAGNQQLWLDYVSSTIQFMSDRLDKSSSHTEHLLAYENALSQLETAVNAELPPPEPTAQKSHRRSSSFPLTANFLPKQAAQVPGPIGRILQHLDITLETRYGRKPNSALWIAVNEKRDHVVDLWASTESNTSQIVGEILNNACSDSEKLLASLYSNSRYGTMSLEDPLQKARLQKLEVGMSEVGKKMAGAESTQFTLDEEQAEKLVHHWSK